MKCGEARLIMVAFMPIRRFETLARSGTVGPGYELFRWFQVVGRETKPDIASPRGDSPLLIFFKGRKTESRTDEEQENRESSGG